MGQKVNPIGLRVGINRTWDSRWYANKSDFAGLLHEDLAIRKYIFDRLKQAGVSKVIIERPAKKSPHFDSLRPSGCCDREKRPGHREAQERSAETDQVGSAG